MGLGGEPGEQVLHAFEVADRTFRIALRGYNVNEVDAFLDEIQSALDQYEGGTESRLNPFDIANKTFATALRGYDLDEVDNFLDEVVDTMKVHTQRIRHPEGGTDSPTAATPSSLDSRPSPPSAPVAPSPSKQGTTTLTITYTDNSGRTVTVLLDAQQIGKLKPGQTETFDIPEGMHWITVRSRKDKSNVQMIEPRPGDHIRLTCAQAGAGELDDLGRAVVGISLQRVD